MKLSELVSYTNELLHIAEVPDYANAVNGLQLENTKGDVTKIAAAVDAHLPVVKQAIERGCDLLLVHHGLFWSGLQPVTGSAFEKMRLCVENELAIYSAHLPLDGTSKVLAYTPAADDTVQARMFFAVPDVREDPATGSANAALSALLVSLAPGEDVALHFEIEQGVEMGRPSLLIGGARKTAEGAVTATVAGNCVPVMRGTLEI